MVEKCPFCDALFTVSSVGDGGICGACREPIECPHCKKVVREERTTGYFIEKLVKAPIQDSSLSRYLGITDEEWDEMGAELNANTGSSDEMTYYYWFTVPDGTSDDILEKTGWKVGQTVDDIPVWVVDVDESPCH
ncbi:hypothetical protein [Photobacterium leiognathi]|uniref:hypothetical protein n=1 Tax=Photobacterium leiognathi TaxID=553611 RepID=UPI002735E4A1|nr:hypothetical protein [Photobacterium leiognathi]